MKLSSVALSLSLLSLSACGVKLPGGVTFPGGSSSGGSANPDGSAAAAAAARPAPTPETPPSKPQGDLGPYYAGLQLDALYHLINDERQDEIYQRAKADLGRDKLWQSANPNPTWILFWRTHDWTNASENAEAMTQAAFNRAWETSCVKEAAASRKTHRELAAKHGPELARLDGLTNYYERMAGYAALATAFESDAAAAGLAIDKDPSGPVGFRVTILAHAVAFHDQSRQRWAEFPWTRFPGADRLRHERSGARELTDDDGFERARYCAAVADCGGVTTTPFTRFWSEGHMSAQRVAWPTVTGDEKANRARADQLAAEAQTGFETPAPARVETIEKLFGLSAPEGEPKLAGFRELKVTAVKGAMVKVTRTDSESYEYACRTTNRFDHFDGNGHAVYQQVCKRGDRDYRLDAQLTFDELPPGVTLQVGDVLTFAADVEQDGHKQTKNSAARQSFVRTMVLSGRRLGTVVRGKEKLAW